MLVDMYNNNITTYNLIFILHTPCVNLYLVLTEVELALTSTSSKCRTIGIRAPRHAVWYPASDPIKL